MVCRYSPLSKRTYICTQLNNAPLHYPTPPYQVDREAARCELERLLSTSSTDDKRQKIMEALQHLEVEPHTCARTCRISTYDKNYR